MTRKIQDDMHGRDRINAGQMSATRDKHMKQKNKYQANCLSCNTYQCLTVDFFPVYARIIFSQHIGMITLQVQSILFATHACRCTRNESVDEQASQLGPAHRQLSAGRNPLFGGCSFVRSGQVRSVRKVEKCLKDLWPLHCSRSRRSLGPWESL